MEALLEMSSKNHIQYPFATFYDHLHKSGGKSTLMPPGLSQTPKLPVISANNSPEHKAKFGKDSLLDFKAKSDFFDSDENMKTMDNKFGLPDKSNRNLLEEVVKLHGDLRTIMRRNEEEIKDERQSRKQVESSIEIVNELMSKLSARIKLTEDKILEEQAALASLVTYTKGVEQAVLASQQTLSSKKDLQASKIQELSLQLGEFQRNRDTIEKTTYSLTEELRALRSKVDSQTIELTSAVNDIKMRARRLEEENKVQLDSLRKQGDLYSSTETHTTQLRGQVETRLSELKDIIMEMKTRQDLEASERRALEQQFQQKINTLQQNLAEQVRKREEALHAVDMVHREKELSLENDKLRLQGKLTETVDEMNKRFLAKDIKLREEIQDKLAQLEKMIHSEQDIRHKNETTLRDESEKRWHSLKKLSDEEIGSVKEGFLSERQKHKDAVQKLDESISLIEKQVLEQRRQTDKVVAAEIKSRKQHEKVTNEKLDHLNEKLSMVTASLQTAIGGVTGNFAAHTDKLKSEIKSTLAASLETNGRAIADIDARLQSLKQTTYGLEQKLDGRISETMARLGYPEALEFNEATAILAQNLREKVESISLWQDVTSQTIRELNQSIQDLPNEIFALEDKQRLLKYDVDSRLTTETDARIRDIEALKHEMSLLRNRRQPQTASVEDIQEVQATVRKLAETVQTVKTVLGMKLQSEQKMREDDIKELQEEVDRLRKKLDPSATSKNYPRNYNRGDNEDDENNDDKFRDNGRSGHSRDDKQNHGRNPRDDYDDRRDRDDDRRDRDDDRDDRDDDRDTRGHGNKTNRSQNGRGHSNENRSR